MDASPPLLHRHVFACARSGAVIFFDLRNEDCVALPLAQACHLDGDLRILRLRPEAAEALKERGFVTHDASIGKPFALTESLVSGTLISLEDDALEREKLSGWLLWKFVAATMAVLRLRRVRTLQQIAQSFLIEAAAADSASGARARRNLHPLIGVYRWARPFLPPSNSPALLDSLVLIRYLRDRGVNARVVYGIGTLPFRTHVWAQYGNVVLNDDAEYVAQFTPIAHV